MNVDKPQILTYTEKSLNYTAHCTRWIPDSARFIVVGEKPRGTGAFQVFELDGQQIKTVVDTEKTGGGIRCATFAASDSRDLACGDFSGKLNIFDLESHQRPIYTADAHNGIINAIDGCSGKTGYGPPELVTGGKDGCVRVWDPRQKAVPVAEIEPENKDDARDCWTVSFGNSHNDQDRVIAAGFDNGDIKLFDLKSMKSLWSTNIGNGVCSVQFDRLDIEMNKLVATTLENKIHIWDLRHKNETHGFAHTSYSHDSHESQTATTVWVASHLPQNRDVWGTTGGNGSLHIWKYKYPMNRVEEKEINGKMEKCGVVGEVELVQKQTLASQPISSLDWHSDKRGLAVMTSYDQMVRIALVTKLNTL